MEDRSYPIVHYSRELAPRERGILRRAIWAASLGNAIEWYDYGLYALLVVPIGRAFFPDATPATQVLAAFGIFALTFVVRPLGGLVLGPLGDRLGRLPMLVISIVLMTIGSTLIGVIPSYAVIGVAAPALLLLLRLVQGFSTGGEYSGAATFMAEYSPQRQRGLYGSFLEVGTTVGGLLSVGVVAACEVALSGPAMDSWGWRIPFLLAAPLGSVALYLRWKLEDTPVFLDAAERGEVVRKSVAQAKGILAVWQPILILMGLVLMLNVIMYTVHSYLPVYLEGSVQLSAEVTLLLLMIGRVVTMITLPFAGALSDRVGRKPCWYASSLAFIVLSYPAFALLGQGLAAAIIATIILWGLLSLQLGTISATFPALFPTPVRFAGFALGYNISTSLFGGTAPLVDATFVDWTGNNLFPVFYVMGACVVGLIATFFMPETVRTSLRSPGVTGTGHGAVVEA